MFSRRVLVRARNSISQTSKVYLLRRDNLSAFSPNYTTATSIGNDFSVIYLINNLGFSLKAALNASKRIHFETPEKPDSIISFFRNYGFSNSQLTRMIQKVPILLLFNPNTLYPKLQFFHSIGFSNSEVIKTISGNPRILTRSLSNHLLPTYDYVKTILHSDETVVASLKFRSAIITDKNVQLNLKTLRDIGVPKSNILLSVRIKTSLLFQSPETLVDEVEKVKQMGFDPSKSNFVLALHALTKWRKPVWDKKFDIYKKWGWSEREFFSAFERCPWCMLASEHKLEAALEFFVNYMGWESSVLARRPILLLLSLEKRIIPRAAVLQFLLDNGLVKKNASLVTPFTVSNDAFLDKFVVPFMKKFPGLLSIIKEKKIRLSS